MSLRLLHIGIVKETLRLPAFVMLPPGLPCLLRCCMPPRGLKRLNRWGGQGMEIWGKRCHMGRGVRDRKWDCGEGLGGKAAYFIERGQPTPLCRLPPFRFQPSVSYFKAPTP